MRVYGWLAALVIALAMVGAASAQTPDRRGEVVTRAPEYQGQRASAPIPSSQHVRNEGGSDQAGLCVISSMLANGQYQGVPGLDKRPVDPQTGGPDMRLGQAGKGSKLWITAKSRPGGYGPSKLVNLLRETVPGEKYASFENCDEETLDRLSRQGYPIGAVMAWGQGYPGRISHMISLLHYRKGGNACVLDNNYPGEYHWMPASAEYLSRFKANGSWAVIWTRLKNQPAPVVAAVAVGTVGCGVLCALAAVQLVAAAGLMAQREPQDAAPAPGPKPAFA